MKFPSHLQYPKVEPRHKVDSELWQDWRWQIRNSLQTLSDFEANFKLSEGERRGLKLAPFKVRVNPYYACLASETDEQDPVRRILMPSDQEVVPGAQSMLDPLGEQKNSPVPRILHRYSDRALLLVTDFCGVYCRYCTRKHFTAQDHSVLDQTELQQALQYLREHRGIREVLLSGGDPLTLADDVLLKIISEIRKIDHIEIIRIGTRMPVVCPMRVTEDLVQKLKAFHPIFMMVHFNHPRELTTDAVRALSLFVDNGFPVFNQMVLLNGINNSAAHVQALSRRLLYLRVKPYYMFQCDPSLGTDHLRIPLEDSLAIQRELWGHMSGLAMPNLSLDIPQGGGKAYYVPQFEIDRTKEKRLYRGWDGVEAEYINPSAEQVQLPSDLGVYESEWNAIRSAKDSNR